MEQTAYAMEEDTPPSPEDDLRVLVYKEKVPTPETGYQNKLRVLYSKTNSTEMATSIPTRPLPSSPEKTLNAPDLRNDYYLNLLDWGANNILAVALEDKVYLWNPSTGNVRMPPSSSTNSALSSTSLSSPP